MTSAVLETPRPAADSEENLAATKLIYKGALEELSKRGVDISLLTTRSMDELGPQTDNELWEAVFQLTKYRIPRVAVCPGHVAPFTIFADLYFERRHDVLMIGNRGGGKTTTSGFLHAAKGRWKPGYTTAIAGAIDKQSDRAYAEFKRFTNKISVEIVESLKKKTTWLNESATEVLAGTVAACNGPHPHLAQFDELELVRSEEVFEEWMNMSQGDHLYDGQNLLSSTRKRAYGIVQRLVKECEEAVRVGDTPAWEVMVFCIFETMANVPECGVENPDGTLKCGCDEVVKGTWPTKDEDAKPIPRTFASVCNGRAKKAQGFVQLRDVHRRFRGLGRRVWEAQQECLRPSSEGLVHDWYDPALYGLPFWLPKAEYGPIYRSWDWGGTNPHCVIWTQHLKVEIRIEDPDSDRVFVIPEGAHVSFDEIKHPGGGAYSLGLEVMERTEVWAEHGFQFGVDFDFADPANPTARSDVKRAAHDGGYPEPNFRAVPATIENSVEKHVEIGEDGLDWIVPHMCPGLNEEYGEYHWPEPKAGQPPPKKPVLVDDHSVDSKRYYHWNIYMLMRRGGLANTEAPASEYTNHPPRHAAAEHQVQRERAHVYGRDVPVASSMSPGYASTSPFSDRPTVRQHSVRGLTGASGGRPY